MEWGSEQNLALSPSVMDLAGLLFNFISSQIHKAQLKTLSYTEAWLPTQQLHLASAQG